MILGVAAAMRLFLFENQNLLNEDKDHAAETTYSKSSDKTQEHWPIPKLSAIFPDNFSRLTVCRATVATDFEREANHLSHLAYRLIAPNHTRNHQRQSSHMGVSICHRTSPGCCGFVLLGAR
jgi:hypothetical protein